MVEAEGEAVLAGIEHRHGGAVQPREDRDRHADGPGPDHQHPVIFPHVAAANRMGADGQELHHGGLIQREPRGGPDEALRNADELGHSAVAMNPQHLEPPAAVGLADAAGVARAAGQVGDDRHHLSRREAGPVRRVDDLARQLVAHHARIGEIRLVAGEDVQIGPADADAADPHEDLVGPALRHRPIGDDEPARLLAHDGQQRRSPARDVIRFPPSDPRSSANWPDPVADFRLFRVRRPVNGMRLARAICETPGGDDGGQAA